MAEETQNDMWAVVELMGHGITAGIIRKSDLGGLLRVDMPVDDYYQTQYYGESAIYSIKIVSEEIARAYARPERGIISYDEPIVPRGQYEEALQKARNINQQLEHKIKVLSRRLTDIASLPEPEYEDTEEE